MTWRTTHTALDQSSETRSSTAITKRVAISRKQAIAVSLGKRFEDIDRSAWIHIVQRGRTVPAQEEDVPHLMLCRSSEPVSGLRQRHRIPGLELDRRTDGLHVEWEVAPIRLTDPSPGHVCRVFERNHHIRFARGENLGNEVRSGE